MEIVLKLENFEGPLDLLLNLIETKKMDISSISIHKLIDDYLDILKKNKLYSDVEIQSEFIVLASELVEIKTLALLNIDAEKEKEKELIKRLEDYKIFKEVSKKIQKMENEFNVAYTRGLASREIKKITKEYKLEDISKEDIFSSFNKYLKKTEQEIKFSMNLKKKYSLYDEMDKILMLIYDSPKSFDDIFINATEKMHLIYMFLAILELYKDGKILINDRVISLK